MTMSVKLLGITLGKNYKAKSIPITLLINWIELLFTEEDYKPAY